MEILWWIIVGLVAGWATGKIMKGSGYGFIVDTLLGIAGAVVGGFIARHLGLAAATASRTSTANRGNAKLPPRRQSHSTGIDRSPASAWPAAHPVRSTQRRGLPR
jgi:uncharacterized membrane protein YeaQ/YmgE (transglycosylase-associated protein family)